MKISKTSIVEKLAYIIFSVTGEKNAGLTSIDESTKLEMYINNSIQFVQIIILIEREYKIEIPDEYLFQSEMDTIDKIANIILECLQFK